MRVVLLIARYQEDLTWVENVPARFEVVVVNKSENLPRFRRDDVTVIRSENVGREAETYVSYIVHNYESLPDRIIFSQGDPFEHSPFFLDLLQEFEAWQGFQPLTLQFKDYLPPRHTRAKYDRIATDNRIWVDRADCFTLNTVFYNDPDFDYFAKCYRAHNGLTDRDNLVRHFLSSNGFEVSAEYTLDEVNFSFGAIFSVDSEMIAKHSRGAYIQLLRKFSDDESLPYIVERCWMVLFDEAAAMQESQWSLPLSEKAEPLAVTTSSETHPSRDFVIIRPPYEPRWNPKSVFFSLSEPHPSRDFVIIKAPPHFGVSKSDVTPVNSLNTESKLSKTIQCPVVAQIPKPGMPSSEVHPNRDFIIAKPPTQNRYKV